MKPYLIGLTAIGTALMSYHGNQPLTLDPRGAILLRRLRADSERRNTIAPSESNQGTALMSYHGNQPLTLDPRGAILLRRLRADSERRNTIAPSESNQGTALMSDHGNPTLPPSGGLGGA